ncbi:MAG: hypothetical protein KGI52_03470 [Burkholderiales bacterium]|nr:hypothetical protein [Burkholderiales bacterium]
MTDQTQAAETVALPDGLTERLKRSIAWLERGELLPGNAACIDLDDIKALHGLVESLSTPPAAAPAPAVPEDISQRPTCFDQVFEGLEGPEAKSVLGYIENLESVIQSAKYPRRTIYDRYRSLNDAAIDMWRVLGDLTDALRENQSLAKSIESSVREDAYAVVDNIRRSPWSSDTPEVTRLRAMLAAAPAAPSQEPVTLTDEQWRDLEAVHTYLDSTANALDPLKFKYATYLKGIIAALREKEGK